jgi:hypothetical protein
MMFSLIFWTIVGLTLFLGGPTFVNRTISQHSVWGHVIRGLGLLLIVWGVASTSYVHVPDGSIGELFRVYGGGAMPAGRIVAQDQENGPQARVIPPGFHPELLVNVLYNVHIEDEVNIPAGKVGVLTAVDGAALRPGQAFADPFPSKLGYQMLDAETFLKNGGQRGPQLTVLTPGTYRLNGYLWRVTQAPAEEIPVGFVGVVKSNVHADIDFGTLQAKKPDNCDVIKETDTSRLAAPIVPVGCIGVWQNSLQPGKYYFNPDAFAITNVDTRAQVWNYAGGYNRAKIDLTVDAKGDITQKRTETEVAFNPEEQADRAVFVKMEGWDVPLELRVVAQVSPDQAACVIASVGGLKQVEDRVLTPSIRAITRDVSGGSYEVKEPQLDKEGHAVLDKDGKPIFTTINRPTKVLDLINQRPLIEGEIEKRFRPEAEKACVTIREVRLGEPAIPPELLVAVRREQLATQLAKAFIQEQAAQAKRIDSEKAKSTADKQPDLVTAQIAVQTSEQNAIAARNEGQGERDKLALISEGQKAQVEVLGTDATVRLRQFELVVDYLNAHPDVLVAVLSNASKFVPQITVGQGASGGLLDVLLGQYVAKGLPAPSQNLPSAPTDAH